MTDLDMGGDDALMVLLCGEAGVGKTTVARTLAPQINGQVMRTDVVRKELFDDPTYTAEETNQTYAELHDRARNVIRKGIPIVLDGTYRTRARRDEVAGIANECDIQLEIIRVTCEKHIVKERLSGREDDARDAEFDVYLDHRTSFEPVDREHTRVDTSGGRDEVARQISDIFH